MKHIDQAIKSLFQEYGFEKKVDQCKVIEYWPKLMGKSISNISQARKVENDILLVKVKSSAWKTELLMQKPQLLKKINTFFGNPIIKDIRFI